jgi:hypothetical protein
VRGSPAAPTGHECTGNPVSNFIWILLHAPVTVPAGS